MGDGSAQGICHPPSTAWLPLFGIACLLPLVHLCSAGNYGIFRDEYYYLACSDRLAWGYVDHPPLSIALLAGLRELFGDGLLALRLVPALCAAALVLLVGRLAATLGGGRFAQILAALAVSAGGIVQGVTGFYSMNALDLVFWALAWLLLAELARRERPSTWIVLGVTLGLGLLNKIGLLVFGAGLAAALVLTPNRRWLASRGPWIAAGLALLIFLPHLLWQVAHDGPTLEFIENVQRDKIKAMAPLEFLGVVVEQQNPILVPLWLAGLAWLFLARAARAFRFLGVTMILGFGLFVLQAAKPYYVTGLFPLLLAAGACALDSISARRSWARRAVGVVVLGAGGFALPIALPLFSPASYLKWEEFLGMRPAAQEVGHDSDLPQHFSDRFGWEELAVTVSAAYGALPEEERAGAVILAQNYGHAGALEYWARTHGLPAVLCGHNSYWFWWPEQLELETVVCVGWWNEEALGELFEEIERVPNPPHPWALEQGVPIHIARRPRKTLAELRAWMRSFI